MQRKDTPESDYLPVENDPGDSQQSDDPIKTGLPVEGEEPTVDNKSS